MAVNGYTEDQFKELLREIRDEQKRTLGPKGRRNDSSSEVPITHPANIWLLSDSTTKDNANDSEQSPSEQVKKRRRRGKRDHHLKPGPKSGQSGTSKFSTFFEYVS